MSTIAEAITPATLEAVTEATVKPAPRKSKSKPAPTTPAATEPTLDEQVAALRKRYDAADKGEAQARATFELADIQWQNSRVVKVRVAYAAAMLTPNKGAANLLAATRYLLTDPTDTPAKRTAQAKSRKNTLRNYVAAGEALQEAGLANNTGEPDENERKIVANVFREMNKRDKAEAKGEQEPGEPGDKDPQDPDTDESLALGVTDLLVKIAELQKTFNLIKTSSVVVSETDAEMIQDMLANFSNELTAYSTDK